MTLRQRKSGHMRLQGGALYAYDIVDDETVVGSKTVHINKKTNPWKETATYFLGDVEFKTAAEFRTAYERQKLDAERSKEWDAAAPKTGDHDGREN